jgi:hypothetical protein
MDLYGGGAHLQVLRLILLVIVISLYIVTSAWVGPQSGTSGISWNAISSDSIGTNLVAVAELLGMIIFYVKFVWCFTKLYTII